MEAKELGKHDYLSGAAFDNNPYDASDDWDSYLDWRIGYKNEERRCATNRLSKNELRVK